MRIANYKPILIFTIFSLFFNSCLTRPTQGIPVNPESEKIIYDQVKYQLDQGARVPESEGHSSVQRWIIQDLTQLGWKVSQQIFEINGHNGANIIAEYGSGKPLVLIGAHYDSRIQADQDKNEAFRKTPVPGANDGASGVALLLDLARKIPSANFAKVKEVQLAFFDLEDNGDLQTWDWILGSTAYVQSLDVLPDGVVIVDMIGDRDLQIYYDLNSNPVMAQEIWTAASELGYNRIFIPKDKYRMIDDHMPFSQAGIPAVDIIDYDYPYWHTTQDTLDKISAGSILVVSETILHWLANTSMNYPKGNP